jgi:hypothetical protein
MLAFWLVLSGSLNLQGVQKWAGFELLQVNSTLTHQRVDAFRLSNSALTDCITKYHLLISPLDDSSPSSGDPYPDF